MSNIDKQALCIENAFDIANQLYELANNEIECDLFAVTSTNENGTEIEFERPITDLALEAHSTINALLNRLAAAEKRNAEQREYYEGVIADGGKRIAELEKGHQEAAKQINSWRRLAKQNIAERGKDISELEAARQRIAELEARTVNLSKLSVDEVMHMSGFSRDYAEGWCAGNDNAIHEIRTAGIKVKGE